jgi:hypothetical protein
MIRLPHVLLLVLLVSNIYAAENTSSPANINTDNESISGAKGEISNGALVNDALSNSTLANSTLANSAPNVSSVEPFTVLKRSERPDRFYRASQLAFVGSIIADMGTTWTLPKGMTEGNPLLGKSKAQQASVSSALALFTLWEAHSLHVRGNTKAAKYLLWMGTIAHAFAGCYNAR